jgi:hypothetical protein
MSLFKKLIKRDARDRHEEMRQRRKADLEALGYRLQPGGVLTTGKKAVAGYTVVTPDGSILDKEGRAFTSSREAFQAAMTHAEANSESKPPTE